MEYIRVKVNTPTCKGCCFANNQLECNGQTRYTCYDGKNDYVFKEE